MTNNTNVQVKDLLIAAAIVGSLCGVLVVFGALVLTIAHDVTSPAQLASVLTDKQASTLH